VIAVAENHVVIDSTTPAQTSPRTRQRASSFSAPWVALEVVVTGVRSSVPR